MKKLFLFLCLGLSVLFVGCSNETITNNNNDVEETAEEEIQVDDFNSFASYYITYTDTLNSYMESIINTYTNDSIVDSYDTIKSIKGNVSSMNINALKNSSSYESYKQPVDYLESYKLVVYDITNLVVKSYDKVLTTKELSQVEKLITDSANYSDTCNKFANVFEKYIQ